MLACAFREWVVLCGVLGLFFPFSFITHPPRMFLSLDLWEHRNGIVAMVLPSIVFTCQLEYSTWVFQVCGVLSLRNWWLGINNSPLYAGPFFGKYIQNKLFCKFNTMENNLSLSCWNIEVNLPKGPYPPCLRMADRALLAGCPRYILIVPGDIYCHLSISVCFIFIFTSEIPFMLILLYLYFP